jgi:choline-sulfatase
VQAAFRRFLALATGHVRTRDRQLCYARFYAFLHQQVDREIGKLLDALDRKGLTEDTIVIRTSDHGEMGMAHGRSRQKFYNAYRETLSIPLIFSSPVLFPQHRTSSSMASLIDVLPTLASVGELPECDRFGFKGHDLTPIFRNPTEEVQDFLHFTYEDDVFPVRGANFLRAVVDGGEPAVTCRPDTDRLHGGPHRSSTSPPAYELYDLAQDPLEMRNLAHAKHSTPASEAERARLHRRLADVMQDYGTRPDEIRWPTVDEYRPESTLVQIDEGEGASV